MTPGIRLRLAANRAGRDVPIGSLLGEVAVVGAGAAGTFFGGPAGGAVAAAAAQYGVNAYENSTAEFDQSQVPRLDFTGLTRPKAYELTARATNAFRGKIPDDDLDDMGAALYQQFAAIYGDEAHPRDPVSDALAAQQADADAAAAAAAAEEARKAAYAASVARGTALRKSLGVDEPKNFLKEMYALEAQQKASGAPAAKSVAEDLGTHVSSNAVPYAVGGAALGLGILAAIILL